MSEARERTRRALASDPVVRQLGKLGYSEFERTARAAYARARQVWFETAERGHDADGSVG
jgi:hypothetical protein